MAVALEQFVKQIADSGVVAPGKLENFVPPKAHPKDAQELARQLVQSKQLTKYQAQEIYQGRSKSLILGNYTILDKIGAGGMGQVFKAEHRRMHRVVAIKMLPKNVTKDALAIARFQREVDAAAKLEHPNIVTAHDADDAGGVHFLVMQYVEGSDLSALVKKHGPLSVEKAVNYILQAARGLEYAHKKGVIHRDIKPANLLLDNDGVVKILDMGLARLSADDDTPTQAELTGTGAVMGTVDYMAPEQALSTKHADARADIYSLGCSLCYLITGKAAYDGDTLMAKLLAHRDKPIPSLGPNVPEQLQAVFQKMVAKKVEDRYQTMSEVVAALQECAAATSSAGKPQIVSESSSDNGNLSFLAEATAHTLHHGQTKQEKPVKDGAQPAKKSSGWDRKRLLIVGGAVGAGLLAAAILAAVVFKLRTKDGTLLVEVNQPDAVVQVDGNVEITQPGGKGAISISVDPGKHRLKVEKDGFQFFAQDFEMDSGGTATIKATLVEDKPWFKPAFLEWQKGVAAMPAEKQVEAVAKKLQELNPGFDGKVNEVDGNGPPKIDNGVVTELAFSADNVTDVSPVRALLGLKSLQSDGSNLENGKLSDLSPLKGLRFAVINCNETAVHDLSPLAGMPLGEIDFARTRVSDLSPLKEMQLGVIMCDGTAVADLAPLKGMPLDRFHCNGTPVSDLSPLKGTTLKEITFSPGTVTKGIEAIRAMNSLEKIGINWKEKLPAAEFWKKYDAGEFGKPGSTPATPDHTPITTFNDPAFQQWMKEVATMPADKQADAVVKKLQELNPGFDGHESHEIEKGVVIRLEFANGRVTDISPVRALRGLKSLECWGTPVSDLSPLVGMSLTHLNCDVTRIRDLSPLTGMPLTWFHYGHTDVADLSPLKGMPLKELSSRDTKVSDLSALKGMPLTRLEIDKTLVSDLSPLHGMPLSVLYFNNTNVSDLSPLEGMNLESLWLTPKNITKGLDVVRQMKTIGTVGLGWDGPFFPPAEFWKKYDAGEFGKPGLTTAAAKKPLAFETQGFDQWVKGVAGMPADQQVAEVAKKLTELNPGFEGKVTSFESWWVANSRPKIEGGVVTEIGLLVDNVIDLSPVRALAGLKKLACMGNAGKKEGLSDLSPLKGMRLVKLTCRATHVSDLSPLRGMQLEYFDCGFSPVADLSPLKGMPLTYVRCEVTAVSDLLATERRPIVELQCDRSQVSDLSPLKGMPLTSLICPETKVSGLSPLKGMKLANLKFDATLVSDLSPLKGMPLIGLDCHHTRVSDLAPLTGMPLAYFQCDDTPVSDLSPLQGTALKIVFFTPKNIATGIDAIRRMKSLETIGVSGDAKDQYPAAEFWKKYDAGEFGKPDLNAATPDHKPIATLDDPAFQQWMKNVAELPVDKQADAVAKKLLELNPGLDTKVSRRIEGGAVTEIGFGTGAVTNIAPVRALAKLKRLTCEWGKLTDLSPLRGASPGNRSIGGNPIFRPLAAQGHAAVAPELQ